MRKVAILSALGGLVLGCSSTNVRQVDAPRPATGCRNFTSSVVLEARVLQDVPGGCVRLWFRKGGSDRFPDVEQNVGQNIGIRLWNVTRLDGQCIDAASVGSEHASAPTSVSGWLSLDAAATGEAFLNVNVDVGFADVPPAQIRIENLDLNDREGWLQCEL